MQTAKNNTQQMLMVIWSCPAIPAYLTGCDKAVCSTGKSVPFVPLSRFRGLGVVGDCSGAPGRVGNTDPCPMSTSVCPPVPPQCASLTSADGGHSVMQGTAGCASGIGVCARVPVAGVAWDATLVDA